MSAAEDKTQDAPKPPSDIQKIVAMVDEIKELAKAGELTGHLYERVHELLGDLEANGGVGYHIKKAIAYEFERASYGSTQTPVMGFGAHAIATLDGDVVYDPRRDSGPSGTGPTWNVEPRPREEKATVVDDKVLEMKLRQIERGNTGSPNTGHGMVKKNRISMSEQYDGILDGTNLLFSAASQLDKLFEKMGNHQTVIGLTLGEVKAEILEAALPAFEKMLETNNSLCLLDVTPIGDPDQCADVEQQLLDIVGSHPQLINVTGIDAEAQTANNQAYIKALTTKLIDGPLEDLTSEEWKALRRNAGAVFSTYLTEGMDEAHMEIPKKDLGLALGLAPHDFDNHRFPNTPWAKAVKAAIEEHVTGKEGPDGPAKPGEWATKAGTLSVKERGHVGAQKERKAAPATEQIVYF